jgi:di/tricarboxylate transporter
MGFEGIAVLAVIGIILVLLITTQLSVDLILLAGLTTLLVFGIIDAEVALAGFSNEGMLTVAALYVVAAGLKETGAIQRITQRLLGNTENVRTAQAKIMASVMALSAFMNNTPIVASFIPALEQWSKKTNIPLSKLLIPLSYAAILGGSCTLIGTSTNLILNGLLIQEPSTQSLGLFEPALIGIPAAIVGFLYLYFIGHRLLPTRGEAYSSFSDPREYTMEMLLQAGSPMVGKSVQEAGLRQLNGGFLIEIHRGQDIISAVSPGQILRASDRLIFTGVVDSMIELQQMEGLQPATNQVFKLYEARHNRSLLEAVVSATHPLRGKSIKEGGFRSRYNAVVLAVSRSGSRLNDKVGDIVLRTGDTLLIEASTTFLQRFRNASDYYLISPIQGVQLPNTSRSSLSLAILIAMVVLAGTGLLSMLQAAFLAAGIMIVLRVIGYSSGIEAIDWRILLAIAASLGLGGALQATGVAELIAEKGFSSTTSQPYLALMITYFITWGLTELITNNAAAVLIFPLALAISQQLGVDFTPFAFTIIMAASASFSTPMGYQTNLMIYGPGNYRYTDFLKIGLPLNLIIAALTLLLVPKIWAF